MVTDTQLYYCLPRVPAKNKTTSGKSDNDFKTLNLGNLRPDSLGIGCFGTGIMSCIDPYYRFRPGHVTGNNFHKLQLT